MPDVGSMSGRGRWVFVTSDVLARRGNKSAAYLANKYLANSQLAIPDRRTESNLIFIIAAAAP